MQIADILRPEGVACNVVANSKKGALELLAELIVRESPQLTKNEVFDSLFARERLGTTGLGNGVAIPHGRSAHIEHAVGAFLKIVEGIDFDAVDGKPVDVLFALLVPEQCTDEHLRILARLADLFSRQPVLDALREADTAQAFKLLTDDGVRSPQKK